MATLKSIRALYQGRINALTGLPQTGITNVKAQIYLDGVAKDVATNALALTELDSTNSPGVYELYIPTATLTTIGAVVGQKIEVVINSATYAAQTIYKDQITAYYTDDLAALMGAPASGTLAGDIAALSTKVGTPAGASVSADIASAAALVAAIKADLESGPAALSVLNSGIQSLQNASIGNGVGFVLPTLLIPSTGSNTYKIPITIQNDAGSLVDPASNSIVVGVTNAAGVDRGSFLTGSTGSPATVVATRSSQGQYYATVVIPSTEVEEELVFSFAYTVGSNSMVRFGVSQTLNDTAGAGYALQSTLLATQTTVNNINSAVTNGTYGLSALQALLVNSTYGLAAQQAMLANATYGLSAIQTTNSANNALLTNSTYGLQAQQIANTTAFNAIEGTGFSTGQHSLVAIANMVGSSGGKAI